MPGDLITTITRREYVYSTLYFASKKTIPFSNVELKPRWVTLNLLVRKDGYPPAILVGVFEETPNKLLPLIVNRWHYIMTPEVVGWTTFVRLEERLSVT